MSVLISPTHNDVFFNQTMGKIGHNKETIIGYKTRKKSGCKPRFIKDKERSVLRLKLK